MIKIAILDDYADVALKSADWSKLKGKAEISEVGILGRVKGVCSENAQPAAFFIIVKGCGPLHR